MDVSWFVQVVLNSFFRVTAEAPTDDEVNYYVDGRLPMLFVQKLDWTKYDS